MSILIGVSFLEPLLTTLYNFKSKHVYYFLQMINDVSIRVIRFGNKKGNKKSNYL